MKVKDRVFLLSGLDVEEYEVYQIDGEGAPWAKRSDRIGRRLDLNYTYSSIDGAVSAARNAREREVKRLLRQVERVAINTNIKVRLMKTPPSAGTSEEA